MTEKIKCKVPKCSFESHVLVKHVEEAHGLDPSKYVEKFDGDLWSPYGLSLLQKRLGEAHERTPRPRETVPVKDLFGFDSKDTVDRFVQPGPRTPPLDPTYVFPPLETHAVLMALSLSKRNRAWVQGPSGSGKTQLVINICALLNAEVFRANLDAHVGRAELIGEWVVKGKEMEFQYGLLPLAMRRGGVLLLDEWDLVNPHTAAILRPVLEDPARIVLLEKGDEVVEAHPDFRVVVTSNTWGRGDDTGLYASASVLSEADRQRFSFFIRLDYPEVEAERKILAAAFPDLSEAEASAFLKVGTEIRNAYKAGRFDASFSPRQLVNWVEKYTITNNVMGSARLSFLNGWPPDQEMAVGEFIQHSFPNT